MDEELEYAVKRINPESYLFTPDGSAHRLAWESDEDNGTWFGSQEQAYALRDLAGLGDDSNVIIASREIIYEEGIEPDEIDRMLDETHPW